MTNSPQVTTESVAVYVIGDDTESRDALTSLLSPSATVHTFASAEEFLQQSPAAASGCLLVDQSLPGMSGNELLRRLHDERRSMATVLVTALPDTSSIVDAMRHGAVTVLEKPCVDEELKEAVQLAIEQNRRQAAKEQRSREAADSLEKLSDNEREVLQMVLDGVPNKQIARRMGVCVRTIESRRSKIYQATRVNSVAELARLCVAAGFIDS